MRKKNTKNMPTTNTRMFVCDFETTVYDGQEFTEVWASAVVEMYTENVEIFHSIDETLDYFINLNCNCVLFYHNLKFDGEFWLYYLLKRKNYKQACVLDRLNPSNTEWTSKKDMPRHSIQYRISDRGQWYSIIIKTVNHYIEIRDSLKLLPFSVDQIGKSFKTEHQKLTMEYKGKRYAGCPISDEEKEYIRNDVLVVKEALEFMFREGHDKITIGSCCLTEYKKLIGSDLYKAMFPNLKEGYPLDKEIYGSSDADEYIRKSYKGGWCYVVKGKENKRFNNGLTADVNSLYPSVMSGESNNKYPLGYPRFWKGNYIPDKALREKAYFFVRINTRFYIKKNKLPFIQIKGNWLYGVNECLETSDYYDRKTGKYLRYLLDENGNKRPTTVELTLTCTDYKLFLEHYDVEDFEILDGCWFGTEIGAFDLYIDKYKEMKLNSTGSMRMLAKLFLNNLYGKLATNDNSGFKLAFDKNDLELGFIPIPKHDKKIVFIPAGSAVTSYARNFTIRAAQQNYYGVNKRGFIYADTDSIHCDLRPEELKGIKVHDKNFLCWKIESLWDEAIFTRQKTYIEHVVAEDLNPIEPYYNIKCAGMPDKCKKLFEASLSGRTFTEEEKRMMTAEECDFLFDENGNTIKRTMEDFKIGLQIPSKLVPKRIIGGVVLKDTYYTMRNKI